MVNLSYPPGMTDGVSAVQFRPSPAVTDLQRIWDRDCTGRRRRAGGNLNTTVTRLPTTHPAPVFLRVSHATGRFFCSPCVTPSLIYFTVRRTNTMVVCSLVFNIIHLIQATWTKICNGLHDKPHIRPHTGPVTTVTPPLATQSAFTTGMEQKIPQPEVTNKARILSSFRLVVCRTECFWRCSRSNIIVFFFAVLFFVLTMIILRPRAEPVTWVYWRLLPPQADRRRRLNTMSQIAEMAGLPKQAINAANAIRATRTAQEIEENSIHWHSTANLKLLVEDVDTTTLNRRWCRWQIDYGRRIVRGSIFFFFLSPQLSSA